MDRNRNVIVELEDRKIGFRFDNWVLKESQLKTKCSGVNELIGRISNMDLEVFTIILMEAYNEYNYFMKSPEKINERQSSELIDEIGGMVTALEKINEGLTPYVSKNPEPPQKVGETLVSTT